MSKRIAFLSLSNTDGWFIDDDLAHAPLRELGWNVQNIPWDQDVDWDKYDIVVIRSPWDYQQHLERFKLVLKRIEDSRAMLLNPLDTVLWNMNKSYLFDLEKKGVEIVPTVAVTSPKRVEIQRTFDLFHTDEIILKPIVGANADDTFRITKNKELEKIVSIFEGRTGMIQPFMRHIIEEGEYSLMYFSGELSHVILKTVKEGDYRVQEEHGGDVLTIKSPEDSLVVAAQKVMSTLSVPPLYARVDLVRSTQNTFALMELELIEPCLYFRFDENAASTFARCIDSYWSSIN